jgi:hypothetical protein
MILLLASALTAVTFTKDVAPIFNKNCVSCHREGEAAPMSLTSYQAARPWARSIREKIVARAMPPWHADPQHGSFGNARALPQKDIDTIVAWVDGGMKEGDPKDLPPAPKFMPGWNIGQPDAVFKLPEPEKVPATGVVAYRHITVPTNFTEDHWVQAAEIRPGNRGVVHHVIVYVIDPPESKRPSLGIEMKFQPAPGGGARRGGVGGNQSRWLLAGMAPGTFGTVLPPGTGKLVKAGSRLLFQMHYTPNGTAAEDQTVIGLRFAKNAPQHNVNTVGISNPRFAIPPGEANYKVTSAVEFTEDAVLYSLYPHMHLRGKAFEYRLVYPDATSEVILSVPKYDFNWQYDYEFAQPLRVPKGARLECTAYFDNSKDNKFNPDPSKEVRWGDQTWEEMMIGWMSYAAAGQKSVGTPSGGGN